MEAPQCRFWIYGISWGDAETAIAQAFLSLTYYGKSPAGSGGSSRKSRSPGAHRAFSLGGRYSHFVAFIGGARGSAFA